MKHPETPKPKCYLVCGEMDYEPHKFEQAKVFLVKEEAEAYKQELLSKGVRSLSNQDGYYGYPEIIELDLLLKH